MTARLAGLAAAAFLGVFLLWPLAVILWRSFSGGSGMEILLDPWYLRVTGFTVFQALLSTVLTVLVGLPGAILFGRLDFPGKGLLRSLLTVPFVMPTVVAGMGFLALAGPRGLTGLNLQDTLLIILLAHVFYNSALVIRTVGSYLEAVSPALEQAAATLGANGFRRLVRVTLPLAWPAILAAAALVFALCFTSFGVIVLLAPRLPTLEVEIWRLTSRLLQLDQAAVLVVLQLMIIGAVTWFYTRLQARLAVPVTAATRQLPRAGPRQAGLLIAGLAPALLLLLAPLVALVWQTSPQAFSDLFAARPTAAFPGAGRAILNSLTFAGGSMVLSLLTGLAFAYAVVRGGMRWLDGLSLLPLATSAITLAFGYLLAFPGLTASPWGLLLAHTLMGFPFVARSLLPALRGISPSLPAAAATLGAGGLSVLRRIDLPLLVPALLSAAAFGFAISMGEFGSSLVLTRPETATIPVAIYDRLGRPGMQGYQSALALSVILMGVTALAMLLLERRGRTEL